MTLDEAIDRRFQDIPDDMAVKVLITCHIAVPARSGYTQHIYSDALNYKGEKRFLKLIPHYSVYSNWIVTEHMNNLTNPMWLFEGCVESPKLSAIKDMSVGKLLMEIDLHWRANYF